MRGPWLIAAMFVIAFALRARFSRQAAQLRRYRLRIWHGMFVGALLACFVLVPIVMGVLPDTDARARDYSNFCRRAERVL